MLKKLPLLLLIILCQTLNTVVAQKTGSYMSIDLDGTDDYIAIPDHSNLNPTAKITVEAWIKADAYSTSNFGNSIFCKHGWASGNKGYVLRCGDNGKLGFNIANASNVWVESVSGSVMTAGVWYHVAGVFTGDSINTYVNGNLESTALYSGAMSPSTGLAPKIGDLAYGSGRFFNGQIDEVRVWNTALDKATLRNWMCRKITNKHPHYGNLGGYWKLDESSGVDAPDKSTSNNTGTLTNGPQWLSSGATLGDTSSHVYGTTTLSIQSKFGDILNVKNISGKPKTVHAVINYGLSEQRPNSSVLGTLDSTHYFSVYYEDNSSVNYNVNYNFKNHSKIIGVKKCATNLLIKPLGNTGTWNYSGTKLYDNGDSIVLTKQTKNEFVMAQYPLDSNQLISTNSGIKWFCGGDSLLLLANGNDSFVYNWYKNGTIITGKTKKTFYANSDGKYKVKLTRKGTNCSFTSANFEVSSRSTNVTYSNSFNVCQNSDSIKLTGGLPAGGYYSGKWVTSNGYFHPKKASVGPNAVTYNYIDTNNCNNKANSTITILDTIKLTVTAINNLCIGSKNITLNNVAPLGGTYGGKFVNGSIFDVKTAGIGNHSISYLLSNTNSCKSKAVLTLKINKPDSTNLLVKSQVCAYDAPFEVKVYPAGGTLLGAAIIGKNFYPPFATPGWQWVYYKITDSHQCDLVDSAKIFVAEITKAGLKFIPSVCDNNSDFNLTGGTPMDSGKYYLGATLTSVFSPKTKGKGIYKIEYKVVNHFGCRDSAFVNLRVNASPLKPIINLSGNTLLSNSSIKNQWYDKNGEIAGAKQQNYNPLRDGSYLLKVTNDSNCVTSSDSFIFKKVGVKSILQKQITIFPNPSNSGIFNLDGLTINSELLVFDNYGRELIRVTNYQTTNLIDLSHLARGNYWLYVKNNQGFAVFLLENHRE